MEILTIFQEAVEDELVIKVPENLRGKRVKVEVSAVEAVAGELTLSEKKAILAKNKGSMPATTLTIDEKLTALRALKGIFADSTWTPGPEDELYLQE